MIIKYCTFPLLKQNDNKNLNLIDEKVENFINHVCVWKKNLVNTHGSVLISLEGCSKQQINKSDMFLARGSTM